MFLLNEITLLLASNLIFTRAIGLSTVLLVSKSRKDLICTASVITVFTTIGSIAAYFINWLLGSENQIFALALYTLSTALIYVMILAGAYIVNRKFFGKIKKFIHLSAFNTAVTGSLLVISENDFISAEGFSLTKYIFAGLESGLGFVLVSLVLSAAIGRLDTSKVPRSFRGLPAMLVYLGIISMAFYSAGII